MERYYYELRKGLFDFDEVLAAQREATYAKRDRALLADAATGDETLREMCSAVVGDIINANWKGAQLDGAAAETLHGKLQQFFAGSTLSASQLTGCAREDATAAAVAAAHAALDAKWSALDGVRSGLAFESARFLSLVQIDTLWKEHIKAMNYVKDFAGLKVYAQEDPLDVYREEGLKLFEAMQRSHRQNTVFSFFSYQPK